MKVYEKPRLVALSLSGNDVLCAGCAIDAVEPNMNPFLKEMIDGIENPFAQDDDCFNKVEGYCKFASAQIIFES